MSDCLYTCRTCLKTCALNSYVVDYESCPNCSDVEFICKNCLLPEKFLFAQTCNICAQSETLCCKKCAGVQKLVLCDGCRYPVCLQHTDIMDAFCVETNKKRNFYFCNSFEDPHMCFEAFRRLRANNEEFDTVFFGREWLTRTLPELCVTRKWADRQKRKIKSES